MAKDIKHNVLWVIIGLISILYLGNLGAGVIELGPDNLPIAGNIDEFVASVLLLKSLGELNLFRLFGQGK